jgi:hypothetical protein
MSTLALRRTVFLDDERRPDDHEVRHDGETVGRILRLRSTSPTFPTRGGNWRFHSKKRQKRESDQGNSSEKPA